VDDAAKRLKTEPTGEQRGSGKQERKPEPRYLVVGQVVGAHGTRGELRVTILSDDKHRFGLLERIFIGLEDEEPVAYPLESHRLHKGMVLLKIRGLDDRTAAETLRGYLIQIPLAEAIALEEGEYFEHQIIDLEVWTVSGQYLGSVEEIIYTGANDVYVIRGPEPNHRQILVPAIEEVVLEIDLEAGRLVVELPEGLV
jgi:16S rRNA processing protein RimM